jgi:poly-gamma-glutamate synthesis protein (capsule biosynthesis protein)
MKILFTGDINFRGHDALNFEKSKEILSELSPYLSSVDYRIPNLETPLAYRNKHEPIKKSGPNLICAPENIVFLKAFGADGVAIANNHIGDFGEGAIKETLDLLDENGIAHAGTGANVEEAYRAMYFEKNKVRVAIISVCENEFGMATNNTYGSAGYEPRRLLRQIREEKSLSDFVIVVFHGGNEFNPLPSPDTVERYRLVCDMGADAVIGGHTHCPQGYEFYNDKPIVYSMGNLLFKSGTERAENDSWHYGYLCELSIEDKITLRIIPYKFNKEATNIHVFKESEKEKMLTYIQRLSEIIQDEDELARYFSGWAWCHRWIPSPPSNYNDISDYNVCSNLNLLFCEAHYSQSKAVFQTLYREETDIAKKYTEKIKQLQMMPV